MGLKCQTKAVSLKKTKKNKLLFSNRIHPLQFQFVVRQRHLVVEVVALLLVIGDVHGDWTPAEEHPDVAVLWKQIQEGNIKTKVSLYFA